MKLRCIETHSRNFLKNQYLLIQYPAHHHVVLFVIYLNLPCLVSHFSLFKKLLYDNPTDTNQTSEIQQTDKEEEGEAGLEKCPDYLLIYICGFLSFSDGWNVRGVNRKWASAVQQWDLLNSSLHFYDAECINHYISPLCMHSSFIILI